MEDKLRAWLTEELNQHGWTHGELARRSGVSRPLISQVLAGDVSPSADFCIKVAKSLGESPEKLLRLAGWLPSVDRDPMANEIAELVRGLPEDQKKQVLDYVRFLRQQGKS